MNTKSHNKKQVELDEPTPMLLEARQVHVAAPPFLKTRVMAHIAETQGLQRKIWFWRALSSFAVLALVVVVSLQYISKIPAPANALASQTYVIHVDFNETDKEIVAQAEIELPDGVHFVSKNPAAKELRRLKLPIAIDAAGRAKLPFVLQSDRAGEKAIVLRLLDREDRLVRNQVLQFRFAQNDSVRAL